MPKIALALLVLTVSTAVRSEPTLPRQFAAEFDLRAYGALIGRSTWRLSPTKNGRFVWEARSETAGIAALIRDVTITERSVWEYHERSVRPLVYRYDRIGGKKPREAEIRFDWQKGLAHNTVKGHSWQMAIPEGTLDKLGYLLELMRDLAAGKRNVSYTIADGGKLKTYDMRVAGIERIDTDIGRLETLKVRRHREEQTRETLIWCATALGFLPVKVEHREKSGTVVTMQIRELRGIALAPRQRRETEKARAPDR